ncbi:MAG: response regulator transcription factor [Alphaproteobacteria bacterium]
MYHSELKAYIAGGDRLLRQCFVRLLHDTLDIAGDDQTVSELFRERPDEMPHVLLAIEAEEGDREERTWAIEARRRWPLTRIIVLTGKPQNAQDLANLVEGTVDAILSLDMSAESLVGALDFILLGGRMLSAELLVSSQAAMAAHGKAGETDRPTLQLNVRLSPRQREILGAIAKGWSNKEIGRAMNISEATVKVQVRNILSRLGVANRTQAAILARDADPAPVSLVASSGGRSPEGEKRGRPIARSAGLNGHSNG